MINSLLMLGEISNSNKIAGIDIAVIAAYLIGIMLIGIWVGYRKNASSQQYFLAGKSLGWFSIGAALFASNISTLHLVGLAAAGNDSGMVIGNFEWMASFCLILLGLVFAPFYFKSKISTLPEYLEKRYSAQARTCLAVVAIFGALLIHIGISLFAGAQLFESFLGVPIIWSILIISGVTVVYTVLGGLKAVVVTETIQTFLLLGGAILIVVLGIQFLPECGIENYEQFKAKLKPDQMNMVQSIRDNNGHLRGFSWLAVLLGYPILGIWYWCSDQTIVQRVLGAKDLRAAQNGPLFAGFLKILPVFLMVFPGVIGYMMFSSNQINIPLKAEVRDKAIPFLMTNDAIQIADADDGKKLMKLGTEEVLIKKDDDKWVVADITDLADNNGSSERVKMTHFPEKFRKASVAALLDNQKYENEDNMLDYNKTLPVMIKKLIPSGYGIVGLLAAGMLAALMSTIAAALNSCSTLISVDIVKRFNPDTSDAKQVLIGRISAGVVMVLAILWSTQGDQFGTIFEAINKIPMIFAPAVTTVFLMGIFWRRGTNKAALATFAIGCAMGVVYFVMDMQSVGMAILDAPKEGFAGLVTDPVQGLGIPFMLAGPILFAVCMVIYIAVSLSTEKPDPKTIEDVCWDHPLAAITQGKVTGIGDPRVITGILLAIMVVLYLWLS
ncbi:MAG: sodium/solute symporter [Phycisphaerae bacterium]|nr:sodium/solute symporter [Phycisphaerae bacterium]